MVPEIPVPAVADSGSRGNRVGLAKVRVLSLASVGLQTASLRRVRVLSQVSAAVPRGVLHRVVLHRVVLHRVRLPRGAQ